MAFDLQLVFPQETIGITHVEHVDRTTLFVEGDDFTAIDTVTVNEVESTSFEVLSDTSMLLQIPTKELTATTFTVVVTSKRLVFTESSILKFKISQTPSKVTGLLRLIQYFIKILITTPGTDIFSPSLGGGGLQNLGRNFGRNQGGSIISDFVISVNNTSRQIIAIQSRQPQVPANEKLLSAEVSSATFDTSAGALLVSITLTSQTGRSALANLVV